MKDFDRKDYFDRKEMPKHSRYRSHHRCRFCGRFMAYSDCYTCRWFSVSYDDKCRHMLDECPAKETARAVFKLMEAIDPWTRR